MITVLANDRPVARKQHRCDDCGRDIEPGEQYRRQRNIGDDGPYVWKACAQCDVVFAWICKNDRDAFWDDEGVRVRDYLDGADGLDPLRDAVRTHWRGLSVAAVESLLPGPVFSPTPEEQQ